MTGEAAHDRGHTHSRSAVKLDPDRSLHLDEVIHQCLHCGMCLPVCPTYALTAREESSPRGRIRLIRSVSDGSLECSPAFADEMNFCLDCQACETACPAGVHYGELVEEAREWVAEAGLDSLVTRWTKRLFLRGILSSHRRTTMFGRFLRFYDWSGLREAVDRSGILTLFSRRLAERHQLIPRASAVFFDEVARERIPAIGMRRGSVTFLSGCIMNIAFTELHEQAVDLLTLNGFDVIVPKRQPCCGALHGHNGDRSEARRLARETVDLFSSCPSDSLVVDSAGCAAHIKSYGTLLEDDPEYAARARELAASTREITEFLSQRGYAQPTVPVPSTVTYHEACHLVHSQHISREPREMIASVPGVIVAELPEATWCCGSAGIYNITRFDESMELLERKASHIASTGAEIVVTANPGCHLQIEHGLRKRGLDIRVMHPIGLLHKGCGLS